MPDSHRDSVLSPPSGAQSQPEDAQGVPESTESQSPSGAPGDIALSDWDLSEARPDSGPPTKPPTPDPVGGHAAIFRAEAYRQALADIRRVLNQPVIERDCPDEWAGQLDQIEAIVDEAFDG